MWKRYFELYPDRFEFIKEKVDSGIKLTDQFAKSNSVNQADTIMDIVKSKWKPNGKESTKTDKNNTKKSKGNSAKFDKELHAKLENILKKLYPEIKLEYTEDEIQYVDSNDNVMNQEEVSNLVRYTLKVVDTLYDIGTAKPSKHGGNSQPVRSTIKLNSKESPNIEANLTKYLAGKGVPKEQIEYMFEYMRQNNISEIGTLDLAERLLFGLTQNVEIETAQFLTENIPEDIARELIESGDVSKDKLYANTNYYESLTVPGGTNYKEIEVVTPNVAAYLKGHAEFSTDNGIGWYRVDEITEADPLRDYDSDDSEDFVDMFKAHEEQEATRTKTLRVLEMQSDMFQKEKNSDLTKSQFENTDNELAALFGSTKKSSDTNLDMAFNQILNTDNKWVKFFIKSIVQNAERNGYEKIRFPAGETAAKIEGHDTLADIIRKKEKKLLDINNAIPKKTVELEKAKTSNNTYKIELLTKTLKELEEGKAKITKELEENSLEKLAPIEGFYQVRVQNTLKKEYGKDKVKTVTDEHGNTWFELDIDSDRDSQVIMLQQQGGRIKGQADIEAGTVLINSLLQSQDTLPHEYAHHYIAWFRDTPIVQEAIKKWGSEEALVQAIGEQAVKQKGEAWNWWKTFSRWLTDLVSLNSATKKELRDFLTDAFLTRADLREKVKNDSSKEETPKAAGKSGIEGLKSQQEDAAVKMVNMLNSREDNTFILEGEAGTGKSYTVSRVLAQYMQNPNNAEVITVAAATAHKAKDVIGDMIDDVLKEVNSDSENTVTRVVDLRLPSLLVDTEYTKVVVLDEVSMVSPEIMAEIKRALDYAASNGVMHKVIMLGDRAQLRPVISIMNANNIVARKNSNGRYVFKKYEGDSGIEGSFDGENFVPIDRYRADAILPARQNPDGSITIDASSMLLKSFTFRNLENTPDKLRHKLDEQQRNTTATFEAIRKFRTDVIETSVAAENTANYKTQLKEAIDGLVKNGATLLNKPNSKIPKKTMDNIKEGKGVFLSYTNEKVNSANTLFTSIFANEIGRAHV